MRKTDSFVAKLIFLSLIVSFAGGCSLLPVEEEAPPPPVIRSYEKTDYKLADVEKGSIVETKNISCQYSPALEETLSFSIGGVLIKSVYVSTGDVVKKGDVLAELESDDLVRQTDNQTLELEKLKLGKSQLIDTYNLNLKTESIKLESLRKKLETADENQKQVIEAQIASQEEAIATLTNNHKLQLEIYNTRIRVASDKLANLKSQTDQRRLVAGIDGTVTYVKKVDANSTSVENEKFITVADKASSVFIVSGEDVSYLKPGDVVSITLSSGTREGTVIDASELGLEPSDRTAYVRLNETAFDIKEKASGSITIELDRRDDVLYVPRAAVKTANGKRIVYILNEDGIKTMREVETGFEAGGKVEIISGLELGEQVIVE